MKTKSMFESIAGLHHSLHPADQYIDPDTLETSHWLRSNTLQLLRSARVQFSRMTFPSLIFPCPSVCLPPSCDNIPTNYPSCSVSHKYNKLEGTSCIYHYKDGGNVCQIYIITTFPLRPRCSNIREDYQRSFFRELTLQYFNTTFLTKL